MDQEVLKKLEELKKLIKEQAMLKKEVLTSGEASLYTGLSVGYLYRLSSKNIIKAYKPNDGKLYFNKSELKRWMLSKQKTACNASEQPVSEQPLNERRN